MMAYLNAIGTVLAMLTFFGIVWWAFSKGRKQANRESEMLPFVLPDEGQPNQKTNETPASPSAQPEPKSQQDARP
jgi:cytochrome c oxidase cbb3-type subunit 4